MIAIFVDGANDLYTRHYNFPIGTTQKKILFPSYGSFFSGSPLVLLAALGLCHNKGAPTLNFGLISTKFRGIVQAINYRETGVFTFGQKVVFGLKMGLTPKNHPK